MKVYIMTDIEGVAGVSEWAHGNPAGVYYERSKRLLTLEVNAAVEGALEAGATEILVWDGHGPGGLDPELLHPEAWLLQGKECPKGWGLDETFDAMFFVGQHAMSRCAGSSSMTNTVGFWVMCCSRCGWSERKARRPCLRRAGSRSGRFRRVPA